MKFIIQGEESKKLLVKQSGNGGYIYMPSAWIGREVEVILLPEETEDETFVFQRDDFNLPAKIEFSDDGENIKFWNGLEWVEHLSQVQQNESFQNKEVQEEWNDFIEGIRKLIEDPMTFQWAYDLEKGESHTFENGIVLFKQF